MTMPRTFLVKRTSTERDLVENRELSSEHISQIVNQSTSDVNITDTIKLGE